MITEVYYMIIVKNNLKKTYPPQCVLFSCIYMQMLKIFCLICNDHKRDKTVRKSCVNYLRFHGLALSYAGQLR